MVVRQTIRSFPLILLFSALLIWRPVEPAGATTPHGSIASADPSDATPHVLDGRVNAIVQVGDQVIVAGDFSRVRRQGTSQILSRDNAFAFSASSGAIDSDFQPSFDAEIEEAVAHPDGQHVFLVGSFNTVSGQEHRKIVQLDAANGQVVNAFDPDADGKVLDAAVSGNRLYVGGQFDSIEGVNREAFAAISIGSGAVDTSIDVPFEDAANGTTAVRDLDLNPSGSKLVAVGNFTRVAGQFRNQIAVLDIGAGDSLSSWATDRFAGPCVAAFDSIMRSVDVAPDGTWFVVATTGGFGGGPPRLCDTITRWSLNATGAGQDPAWIDYTGGDTTYTVMATGVAVYVGGHNRWVNNPYGPDEAGPGAVPREGIAALDPVNGLPFSWNPGRSRGVGVFDFLATGQGVWVGSDTEQLGDEFHARLGFFPLAGGVVPPNPQPYGLPAGLFDVTANGSVRRHTFDGDGPGPPAKVPGLSMPGTRAAFALGGRVYAATGSGTMTVRSFDGANDGPVSQIDLHGLETAPGRQIPGTTLSIPGFDEHLSQMTGMFWHGGRMYYTVAGHPRLYVRYFSTQANIVGSELMLAHNGDGPVPWANVRGMTFSDNTLFYATPDDRLWAVPFVNGRATGTPQVVGGPGIDGFGWKSRALFIYG